jgi:hypothetical protein
MVRQAQDDKDRHTNIPRPLDEELTIDFEFSKARCKWRSHIHNYGYKLHH